ncbi:hypothetical protein [Sandaracinobacteroides saxicola]|uniref:Uncharacterized protein n=1 Tax=Sandaracinobacteroides saxicola TaxID=2759707 RepID=A0A7G5ILM1_9SPHN|nr:hypothetical protein [Sandaracinobacteroides saxicola]QMW24263.1 hypothetical protein H3309_07360 [Sandaracinobacteroides saxicola]
MRSTILLLPLLLLATPTQAVTVMRLPPPTETVQPAPAAKPVERPRQPGLADRLRALLKRP